MQTKVRKIVIVGGGSAGWMAAASLSKAMSGSDFTIDVVESEEIGTVGVGEATIPSILEFNRTLGIDEAEFIRATQASFKLAIEFVDWRRLGHSYMHPFGFYGVQMENIYFHHFWLRDHAQGGTLPYDAFCSNIIAARAGKFGRVPANDRLPVPHLAYAYHFDAGLYAAYLRKFSEALGARRHEGRIVDVQLRATDGFIESIKLQDGRVIAGDLFIDCSGFRGLLIEQTLKAGYEDWSEYLPCDRAMAVPCARVSATTPYTRSTAREAGWQWRIPLQHRTGNGYVYCSQFMSEDEAASLLLTRLDGTALNTPRPLRFVTGRRKEIWKKNCVALGLASGFLEPLESTSIHLVLASIARLLFMFPGDGFDQATIDKFNTMSRIEIEEIRDFLVLHYTATERDDTPFWRHCRAIRRPDTLKQRLEMFERSANIVIGAGELFREPSWWAVLMGQGAHPKAYHPFAHNITDDELARRLALMSGDVIKRVQAYPSHDEFIRMHCAAPPMPERARVTTPTRTASVDGHDIFVFDDLVADDEAARYSKAILQASFTRTETARPDTVEHRHWVCEMPLENLPRTSLWAATEKAVADARPNERFLPYRVYTNFASFGDILLTHFDALPNTRELTALWYLCERWDVEWGGETMFFDSKGDAQVAVTPKPGRLLLFDGAIRHAGRPPNRNCPVGRYTFAIKLRAA